jgi:undecaprenyl-diphosphatase
MNSLETLVFGIIQGATEFLPISSSAHLIIAQALLQVQVPGVSLEVVLHLGTLMSVLIYFRQDLWNIVSCFFQRGAHGSAARKEVLYLSIATVPAVIVALTLDEAIGAAFEEVKFSGFMLIITTIVLLSTMAKKNGEARRITWYVALVMGIAQAFAILPGISRSGITIVTGIWLGLSGKEAARFAFLMAIPAILGAGIFQLSGISGEVIESLGSSAVGFVAAMLVGYSVIAWLMGILQKGKLHLFAAYTFAIGFIVIFWI